MLQEEARKLAAEVGGIAVTEARWHGEWEPAGAPWGVALAGSWYASPEDLQTRTAPRRCAAEPGLGHPRYRSPSAFCRLPEWHEGPHDWEGGRPVPQFQVDQRVRTNRYFGHTEFADLATVIEIRDTDYVIRFDEPGRHEGDFQVVARSERNLRVL